MNTRLRLGYLDPFNNVARIICDGDPPPWLADQLWRWNGSLYHDRHVEDMRPTRAQMRGSVLEIEEAALLLTEALAPSWVREFLDASPSGPIADPERLIYALGDLQYRASQAQNSPELATKAGGDKAGSRKGPTGGHVAPYVVRDHNLGGVEACP